MPRRFQSVQTRTLQDRLAEFASRARLQLAEMPDGPERERLIKTIRRAEKASELEGPVRLNPASGLSLNDSAPPDTSCRRGAHRAFGRDPRVLFPKKPTCCVSVIPFARTGLSHWREQ